MSKLDEVLKELTEKRDEIDKLRTDLETKVAEFHLRMKELIGIAPGERSDIFEMIEMVKKVVEYDR